MRKTGERLDQPLVSKIADLIAKRGDFIDTINEGDDEEFLHSFNALRILDTIIIRADFWCSSEYNRQFLIYNEHTGILREAHEAEDEMLRAFDDDYDFLDLDHSWKFNTTFLISRNMRNEVIRGDQPYDDSDYVKPSEKDVEKQRQLWAKVAKENGWYEEPFYIQIWYDKDNGEVKDSVSTRGLTQDILIGE